jgi:pyruvate/2-oxoglutarate dehydrogenase complex dihydrolipoamide dehydrogenase (E3) component
MYDAIIIGGGPVGSRAAGRLAEKGHKVLGKPIPKTIKEIEDIIRKK